MRCEAAGTEAHDEIHAIGAVIGKGQRAFDEVLSNADAFDPSWCTDNSAHVLTLASDAYFAMQRAIGSWGGEAFAIKRRTTLNVPAYIQKYSTIPTAEA